MHGVGWFPLSAISGSHECSNWRCFWSPFENRTGINYRRLIGEIRNQLKEIVQFLGPFSSNPTSVLNPWTKRRPNWSQHHFFVLVCWECYLQSVFKLAGLYDVILSNSVTIFWHFFYFALRFCNSKSCAVSGTHGTMHLFIPLGFSCLYSLLTI